MDSIQFDLLICEFAVPKRTVQSEPVDKKLAQGDVPPLLLKNEESDGPEFAFGFLKMWKLRLPLFIDHGLASIPRTRIAVAPKIIR